MNTLFTPNFDRRGIQIGWLVGGHTVFGLNRKTMAYVWDGSMVSDVLSNEYYGAFADGFFKDTDGLTVAFIDPTLAQEEAPSHHHMLSPLMAERIENWSPLTWQKFFRCS